MHNTPTQQVVKVYHTLNFSIHIFKMFVFATIIKVKIFSMIFLVLQDTNLTTFSQSTFTPNDIEFKFIPCHVKMNCTIVMLYTNKTLDIIT
jgi:hypothetical protein